jgi:hypothetical protein
MAWAGAVAGIHDRLLSLPDPYNYPLPQRARLEPGAAGLELDALVHVHLHRWAHAPGFLAELEPALDRGSERYRWLDERLPLEPAIDESFAAVQAQRLERDQSGS